MRSRRAASEEVTTPPSSVMNSRRFIRPPIPHSGRCRRLLSALEFAIGVIPKLADPDSSCVNSSGTSIAKKYSGPMRYGHSAQAPTLAKMSQALRSLVLHGHLLEAPGTCARGFPFASVYLPVQTDGRSLL